MILDPFVGSGSTCIAAIKAKRHYIGYDIDRDYVKLAERRIKKYIAEHSVPIFKKRE